MKRSIYFCLIICLLLQGSLHATVRYVKASGTGNGSSWSNASNDLQLMIDSSNTGDEVWVAGGNYKPVRLATNTATVSLNNRQNAFVMKSGVKVYGGFLGSGPFGNLRAPDLYVTELDGDIGSLNNTSDNAYHIVLMMGVTNSVLDGITIRNGNADGSSNPVYVNGLPVGNNRCSALCADQSSAISIVNCKVVNNTGTTGTVGFGGTTGNVERLAIESNSNTSGGHLEVGYAYQSASVLIQSNLNFRFCRIAGNTSEFGTVNITGGSTSEFYSCMFIGNSVTLNYGSTITNGVITAFGNSTYGNPNTSLINCTVSGNKYATTHASSIYCDAVSYFGFENSIIWGDANTTFPLLFGSGNYDVKKSITQGQAAYFNFILPSGNIDVDPQFMNQPAYTAAPFITGDYHLTRCSPAINMGNNSYLNVIDTTDMGGNKRIISGTVDMGAYEYAISIPDVNGIVYVDSSAAPNGNGSSWASAIPELADALKAAKYDTSIHKIYVAAGTYKPLYTADSMLCTTSDNRKKSFVIPDGVWVMGGYVNGQIVYNNGFPQHPSILSGDIGMANNSSDNAYHVVIAAGTDNANTKLYNFIIENGRTDFSAPSMNVNGITVSGIMGAGMANQANVQGSTTNKGCDIMYCTFRDNVGYYGALSNAFCNNVTVFGTKVMRDSAASGGGIANLGPGTVHIYHSRVSGNKASYEGGGIYSRKCNVYIYNSLVTGNYTNGSGGGIKSDSSVTIIGNCTVASNKSLYNFGGFDHANAGSVQATITNSIFWGNEAAAYMNFDTTNNPLISVINSLAGTEKYNHGIDVRDNTPMFMNPVLAMNAPIDSGDYHLSICSPAINAGNNSYIPPAYYSDMDGGLRVEQNTIDLGPYEDLGRTVSQTPGDSLGNTNFINGCYFTEYTSPANGRVWGSIFGNNDQLIAGYNEANGVGTAFGSGLYPVVFYSKLRMQYGTGNTVQLTNPFGQTGYYYPMNRSWTFIVNGNITAPVRLRLFFDNTDSADIAVQLNFGALQNLIVYKVNGTDPYNPLSAGYKEYTYSGTADTSHFTTGTYQGIRYVEVVVTSLSSIGIALKTTNPLSVKLGKITAENIGAYNRINWNTLDEDRNEEFVLERSKDAITFTGIATMSGRGEASSYTYLDAEPYEGMNYYRLKMTGSNLHSGYSTVVSAFVKEMMHLEIYPNPSNRMFFVKTPASVSVQSYRILNMLSAVVTQGIFNGSGIDVGTITPGNYLLELKTSEGLFHRQISIE